MKNHLIKCFVLFLCCFVSFILHVRAFNWDKLDSLEEIGTLNFDEKEFKWDAVAKRSLGQDNSAPREITTTVKHENQDLTLRFEKKYRVKLPRITVFIRGGNGSQNANTRHQCTWLYENKPYEAFVLVDFCNTDMKLHMIGEVFIKGEKHVVLPDKSSHRLFRCRDNRFFSGTTDGAGPMMNSHERSKRQSTTLTVELMFYIDDSIYEFFYNNNNQAGLTTAEREQTTLEEIRKFYSFIAIGMNYRYSVLSSTAFSIQVKLVSIHIQQVSNSLSGIVDSPSLLDAFSDYIGAQLSSNASFPRVDHYMLITRNDLEFQGSPSSAGLANQGSLCANDRKLAASVAEDRFNFLNEVIFTHELAHGLNAVHDGSNNLCSGADKFIMAADNSLRAGIEPLNLWRFSNCSAQSIENFVNILNTGNFNCMLTLDEPDLVELTPQGPPLGQVYSPDEQCRRIFTSDSAMSRIRYYNTTYEPICTGMWCVTAASDTLALPADGTSCGNGKWCDNGVCVSSNEAPALNVDCAFGDQPNRVSQSQTCAQILSAFLGQCYNADVRFACCQACEAQRLSISGCDYGDRLNCSAIRSTDCYDSGIQTNCCQTCNGYEVAGLPDSCKYGDKNSGCTANACSSNANLDLCCETCRTDGTTGGSPSELPDWVIPVAAGAGGLVLVLLIILAVCCLGRSRADSHVRRVSRMERGRPRTGRSRGNNRRENRYEQPDRRRGTPDYRNGRPSNGRNSVPYTSSSGNPYSSRGYNMYSNGY